MAFIDEITIHASAGGGGDGVVRWRHEKNREYGGPSGGNGGRGGGIYAVAVQDVRALAKYRTQKEFAAERGEHGKKNGLTGANGDDFNILLPVNSIITNLKTQRKISLSRVGERVRLLTGGNGGYGNESFKSSTNQRPKEWTPGKSGQEAEFYIEVELVADIGFIGLPNAGKTSLLNALTRAHAKVGDYPFTTLEPNLGECFGYIIADIPGLIEGAAEGKGLGHKFLRHVRRTKILAHLVALENDDPIQAYKTIRKELKDYDADLAAKKEIIILSKTDTISDEKELKRIITKMKKIRPTVLTVSLYDDDAIKKLKDALIQKLSEK